MNKILVAEDDKDIRENIEDILYCAEYDVVSVKNGRDALNILETVTPDLIISDIRMNELTGLELLEEISKSTSVHIPFLLLTALSSREDIRIGMDMGADDYITKPFTPAELLNSVERRLTKIAKDRVYNERIKSNIMKYIPHELRTPLTPILGYTNMLLDDFESYSQDEIQDMILTIKKSALRLNSRVEKYILFSESFFEKDLHHVQQDVISKYDIEEGKVMKLLQNYGELNGRRKDISVVLEPCSVNILERYFRTIIKELIENASKFSDSGSEIKIVGKKKSPYYEVVINDFGLGMSKHEIRNINAFEQFNREQLQQVGNGLGLVMIKSILNLINGKLRIESKKGEFTKVFISIPIAV